jgi:hypothetical protein
MKVIQFIKAEHTVSRARSAAQTIGILPEVTQAFDDACQLLGEARFFAAGWKETEERVRTGVINGVVGDRIKAELTERLVRFCRPDMQEGPWKVQTHHTRDGTWEVVNADTLELAGSYHKKSDADICAAKRNTKS